jgi:hypothetical protein
LAKSETIRAIDMATCTKLRSEITAALNPIATRFGIQFDLGRLTFNSDNARGKLTMTVVDPAPVTGTLNVPVVPLLATQGVVPPGLPIDQSAVGKTVTYRDGDYEILGVDLTRYQRNGSRGRCVALRRVKDQKGGFFATPRQIAEMLPIVGGTDPDTYPGDWTYHTGESFDTYQARTDAMFEKIADSIIRFPRADGYAVYFVESLRPLRLKHVPYGDAYRVEPATLRGLRESEVRAMLAREQATSRKLAEARITKRKRA